MPVPVVWSERDEPSVSGWHDCTYSAVLMCLIYAGKTDYAYGIYSVGEREALERSDKRRDEAGATFGDTDLAIKNRYALAMRRIGTNGWATKAQLRAELMKPNRAFAIAGKNGNLPYGHPWRRWDKAFDGFHAVCILTTGTKMVRLLDPEATWRFAGDLIDIETVLTWALDPSDARWLARDEFITALPDAAMGGINVSDIIRSISGQRGALREKVQVRPFPSFSAKILRLTESGEAAWPFAEVRGSAYDAGGTEKDGWMAFVEDGEVVYTPSIYVKLSDPLESAEADLAAAQLELANKQAVIQDLKDAKQALWARVQRLVERLRGLKTLSSTAVASLQEELRTLAEDITKA